MMKYIRQLAVGILVAELALATLLLVGLFMPLPGAIEFKIVQSGSMEPSIPVGSVVVIAPAATYAVGDVITFGDDTAKRIPTTHRIAGIEREVGSVRYVTKGDANEDVDNDMAAYPSVIGKVAFSVPRLGYVLHFARSQRGFTFMVVMPAALIVLDELITIVGALREAKRTPTQAGPAPATPRTAATRPEPVRHREKKRVLPANCLDLRLMH